MTKKAGVTVVNQEGVDNTGLAIVRDNDVSYQLSSIVAQIAAIEGKESSESKISKDLPEFGNIYSINNNVDILRAIGTISFSEEAYLRGVKEVVNTFKALPLYANMSDEDIEESLLIPTYNIEGISPNKWKEELVKCFKSIINKDELARLKESKVILEEVLSAEDKRAIAMARAQEVLNPKRKK